MNLLAVQTTGKVQQDAIGGFDPVPVAVVFLPRNRHDTRRRRSNVGGKRLDAHFRQLPVLRGHDVEVTRLNRLVVLSPCLAATTTETEAKILLGPSPADATHRTPPWRTRAAASTVASSRMPYPRSSMMTIGLRLRRISVRSFSKVTWVLKVLETTAPT
jgi:hypothetical protein